ncbi:glycosyltransferase [Marinobacter sp. 71-i]|uniref:Glycosyltransferase n=1 Tax=Marinobacter iranensis TaxID=2962607 RepID=A0ABT5YES0_9GAMM|nr:glycosyltransferase [Marinobacter iranensis]MDF0752168.1 glycosyltransferase [Marinobacter iranensis]
MSNRIARKLRRELLNCAREANLSGWRSRFKYLLTSASAGNSDIKLRRISETLAHFPETRKSRDLIDQAFELARNRVTVLPRDLGSVDLEYCFIIKPYVSESEKGIFLISFENQLNKVLESGLLKTIKDRYHVIFIPSWTGLFSPALFRLVAYCCDDPVFVLPVHEHERERVSNLGSHCISLPFNAASWVNQEFYNSTETERDIDCLIVANFASFKRHWLLFKALKGLPKSVTAVCVGVPLGRRTAESIRLEAAEYGVSGRVKVVENPRQEDLRLYFQRAKVFCAMSYREGSFIAVAEALMSGTPVVMFKNAHIGTKSLITSDVGALVGSVSELRKRVMEFMEFKEHSKVQEIARESISAQANCQKLNQMLAAWSKKNGLKWSQDIEPFYSMRLSFYYFDANARERLRPDYNYLADQGINISIP